MRKKTPVYVYREKYIYLQRMSSDSKKQLYLKETEIMQNDFENKIMDERGLK